MNQDVIERYFALRRHLVAIADELETLKPLVIEQLRHGTGEVRLDGHVLALSTYVAWEYSPRVKSMQDELLAVRLQERRDGTAQVKERRQIVVLRSDREGTVSPHSELPSAGEWEQENSD